MIYPKNKIKIGVHTYKVDKIHTILHNAQELDGLCDHENNVITISDKLSGTKEAETFIHECLHAIEETYKINLGEKKVTALAPALVALFRDNKIVFGDQNAKTKLSRNKRPKASRSKNKRSSGKI